MIARRGPTLRAQWLGQRLRDLREAAGYKLTEAGEYIQRDQSTLSRIETGLVPARVADVLALLNFYGADDEKMRQDMERVARDIWRRGWWEGYADYITGPFIDHAWLEDRANSIRVFEALVVTGLLQTEDYARATIAAADPDAPTEQVDRWVEFRMARRRILDRDEPPLLQVILDEPTIRRAVGGRAVMRAQLRYLTECAGRPDIDVRVLPFRSGAHPSHAGAFMLFEMPSPYSDVAYADTLAGAVYVESDDVRRFAAAYDRLQADALAPAESSDLIAAAVEELK